MLFERFWQWYFEDEQFNNFCLTPLKCLIDIASKDWNRVLVFRSPQPLQRIQANIRTLQGVGIIFKADTKC